MQVRRKDARVRPPKLKIPSRQAKRVRKALNPRIPHYPPQNLPSEVDDLSTWKTLEFPTDPKRAEIGVRRGCVGPGFKGCGKTQFCIRALL